MAAGITREQFRAGVYRGDDFTLVEALSEKHHVSSHPPGAVNPPYEFVDEAGKVLSNRYAEIVVYRMNPECVPQWSRRRKRSGNTRAGPGTAERLSTVI